MVANMTISSHVQKQHQHSPPRKGTADPQKYAWLFKTGSSKSAKADMGGRSSMIPSPDHSSNSWETRAFAEDASSLAAGIWPPRAYPCSFCRREFRSAQALGGHMNVHRRDRARLRHSSPPPTPFCAPLTGPQPMSLFQAQEKYRVNPSSRYPNESLIKLNSPPITLSKSSNLPTNTPYTSLTSSYRSDTATSFPLCLQQLASEAAASLMTYPQPCESADLLSLWPASITNPASFACHSSMGRAVQMKERAMEISSSSSFSSPPSSNISSSRPSMTDATPCRRDAPSIQPEDESPPKKSHTDSNCNHTFNHIFLKCRNSLKDGVHAHNIQLSHPIKTTATETSLYSEGRSDACEGDVDLELRLGQKPP